MSRLGISIMIERKLFECSANMSIGHEESRAPRILHKGTLNLKWLQYLMKKRYDE